MGDTCLLFPESSQVDITCPTAGDTTNERNQLETSIGISWYKATFLIVNAALGAGILSFPYAFHETGGIVPGNVSHVIFFSFALASLIIVGICAMESKSTTYQAVIHEYLGLTWGYFCSISIILYCFVTCATFILIIGDQFDRAFLSFVGPDFCQHWFLNRKFTMLISSLSLIFPSTKKRIDGLKVMSYVGVASVWYLVFVIVLELFIGNYPKGNVNIINVDIYKFFNVVPTILFGYQCHVSSVPIMSCLGKRDKSSVLKACFSSMIICYIVYTLSANCGYLTFGSLVSPDILLDYDSSHLFILAADFLLALKVWTTYPILLFCVREAVADIYLRIGFLSESEAHRSEPKRRKVIAIVVWVLSIVFALFIPGLDAVVNLLGCVAAIFTLILPGMCFLQLNYLKQASYGGRKRWDYYAKYFVGILFIVVGGFTFGLALTLGVRSFMSSKAEKPLCEVTGLFHWFYTF